MVGKAVLPVLVGPFPGPLHGVSVINAKLAERMAKRGVRRIDLSPGVGARGVAYHATRVVRALSGLGRILAAPLSGQRRYVMSVDAGFGLVYNIALALAARVTGQRVLLYHHSSRYVQQASSLMQLLLAACGPSAPQVFCSPKMAALFHDLYGKTGPVFMVGNAAWVDPPAVGQGSSNGLCLGFLSTLTLEKGLGRAIAALRHARGQGLDAELVLAGPLVDLDARMMLERAQAEFGDALSYRGVLTGADKAGFYGALDVFLFPSLYPNETQSLVVPEALAAGTPVIAYDHRFVGEMVGQGGRLVPPTEDFVIPVLEFLATGRDLGPTRRAAARAQYETERARTEGQVEHLIAWACGSEPR